MQASRLFEIVYLLLSQKDLTARKLAEHFEVSTRTIYRDIDKLSEAGIPIYASKGNGGGIRLTENFILNKSYLTEKEQKNILISLQGMNALKIKEMHSTLKKLSALFGIKEEEWLEVNFSSWNSDKASETKFLLLKEAILTRHMLKFCYYGVNGTSTKREVEPMKLIFRGYNWYLQAWCTMRKDFRYFKLNRMDNIIITQNSFVVKSPFAEKQTDTAIYDSEPKINLQIEVSAEKAYRVYDEFAKEQWERNSSGDFIIHFEMPNNEWMYEYLMTYGSALKVISPIEVQKEIIERYKTALKKYQI